MNRLTNESTDAVFGVDLDFLLQRDAPNGEVAPGTLPIVFSRLIAEVEARGLTEIGICEWECLIGCAALMIGLSRSSCWCSLGGQRAQGLN